MTSADDLLRRLATDTRPCLRLLPSQHLSTTYLGGAPELPAGMDWPQWFDAPMSFLAQIDLSAASRVGSWPDWMPREGKLLFFYNAEQSTWGFDPNDRGSWAVLHVAPDTPCATRLPPQQLSVSNSFVRVYLAISEVACDPSFERIGGYAARLDDADFERVNDAIEARENASRAMGPLHWLFGWPAPVQNDTMELDCQLASNGVDVGGRDAYRSPEAKALADGARDWELLFQLDTDDDAKMMWGDGGMLYFWVRRDDAARGDFSNVWMMSQCS
ncbi:MAG: YwqG family protein [Pseudomonadota bacterium]